MGSQSWEPFMWHLVGFVQLQWIATGGSGSQSGVPEQQQNPES